MEGKGATKFLIWDVLTSFTGHGGNPGAVGLSGRVDWDHPVKVLCGR